MGFQMEEILEKIKVGLDPQESFTKMDKDRDVKNRIRGQVVHLNPPSDEEGPKRNEKLENRGPEEHEEGRQQIQFFPHEENTPHQNASNGSRFRVEEDAPLRDSTDGSQYTYSTSTHGSPFHLRQLCPPSPSQQTSSAPWERGDEDSLLLHAQGLAVASFSWHSEARADDSEAAEAI